MKFKLDGGLVEKPALWMEGECIKFIDQRFLPGEVKFYSAKSVDDLAYAIKDMVVRGAPSIGAAAAYGMALAKISGMDLDKAYSQIYSTRPTAKDLTYALDFMMKGFEEGHEAEGLATIYASSIIEKCRKIGENGWELIKNGDTVLTHCNAGALATVDWGTALAPMRFAVKNERYFKVLVDETRPRLQGARLTAWELQNEGIEHWVIADNAAGYYMQRGEVNKVIVGADRICANGDAANKIGTYEKAVLAKSHNIPFYVAAPRSTFDFELDEGSQIPIEERSGDEVAEIMEKRIIPEGSRARNPAFDVTPGTLITGYITEFGIFPAHEIIDLKDKK